MKLIHTESAPAAVGPYSQAVIAGGLVYCSGQIALQPGTGELIDGDAAAQMSGNDTRQCADVGPVAGIQDH